MRCPERKMTGKERMERTPPRERRLSEGMPDRPGAMPPATYTRSAHWNPGLRSTEVERDPAGYGETTILQLANLYEANRYM